ncbi:uncharacterized protein TNCV_1816241 [Trichonephila clavipes]|nr:uncharacterized protein TNCV_1816241 [Trichonephila clavipes]
MPRRSHLDDLTRGRMIKNLEEGCSLTSVVDEFGINKNVTSRAWKAFRTTGTAVKKVDGGCLRKVIAVGDRYIVLQVKRAR